MRQKLIARNLTEISPGNPKFTETGEINLQYVELLASTLSDIHTFQRCDYKLPYYPAIENYLHELELIDDDTLYMMSLKCLPSLWEDDNESPDAMSSGTQSPNNSSNQSPEGSPVPAPKVQRNRTASVATSTSLVKPSGTRPALIYHQFFSYFFLVAVPRNVYSGLAKAQSDVIDYFKLSTHMSHKGVFRISDERYLLIRAGALSKDFLSVVSQTLGEDLDEKSVKGLFYDISFLMGNSFCYW